MVQLDGRVRLSENLEVIRGKRMLVRVDLNLGTTGDGGLDGRHRLEAVKNIVKFLRPAKQIVLISHLGRPPHRHSGQIPKLTSSKARGAFSLKKILPLLPGFNFCDWRLFDRFRTGRITELSKHRLVLLENIRFFPEEEQGNLGFARELAAIGDIFINEAFSASHRQHSSIAWIPKFLPSYFGPRFALEIEQLNRVFAAQTGLAFILGGAKLKTKLPLIDRFLPKARVIILGGGVANTFLAAKGLEIGRSFYDKHLVDHLAQLGQRKLIAPCDVVVLRNKGGKQMTVTVPIKSVTKRDMIVDIGPASNDFFARELAKMELIVWNGPLGQFEDPRFARGTETLARYLSTLPVSKIIGGGDTLNAIARAGLQKKFQSSANSDKIFLSTGGGAMLQYLADGTLPGIDAILKR